MAIFSALRAISAPGEVESPAPRGAAWFRPAPAPPPAPEAKITIWRHSAALSKPIFARSGSTLLCQTRPLPRLRGATEARARQGLILFVSDAIRLAVWPALRPIAGIAPFTPACAHHSVPCFPPLSRAHAGRAATDCGKLEVASWKFLPAAPLRQDGKREEATHDASVLPRDLRHARHARRNPPGFHRRALHGSARPGGPRGDSRREASIPVLMHARPSAPSPSP
jgi:hypothetical protein